MEQYNFIREIYFEVFDKEGNASRFDARKLNEKTNYDIEFNIKKNDKKEPNESSIGIYGLSEETRRNIERNFDYIRLYAGYEGRSKLLAIGDISEINFKKTNPEIKTIIKFQDSAKSFRKTKINKVVPAGVKFETIISLYIYPEMGLDGLKIISSDSEKLAVLRGYTIQNSFVLSGYTKKYLDEICKTLGYEWSIQNNKLIVREPYTPTNTIAIKINESSGLIQSPEKTIIRKTNKDSNNKENLIVFQTLLNPNMLPGVYLKIESELINSFCIAKEIDQIGSNFDTPYYTKVKARLPK